MNKSYIQLVITLFIYSTLGIIRKNINMSSTHIIFLRALFGFLTLLIILLIKKEKIEYKKIKHYGVRIFLSGASMGASWIFLFESYRYLDVSLAILLHYTAPIMVILMSPLVLKEKLTKSKILGVILALFGMFLVNSNSGSSSNLKLGIICGILGAVFYALLLLLNKQIVALPGLVVILFQLLSATVVIFIYMIITKQVIFQIPTTKDLIFLIILGVFHTAIACYLHFESLQGLSAQTVALFGYLDPVLALVWANLILKEELLLIQVVGAVLILFGAIYGQVGDWVFNKKKE